MEVKYIGGDIPWSLPFGDHFNSSNSEKTREIETIARRHGFEPLYSQRVMSGDQSKWMNAGVVFSNKPIDSNLTTGIHHTDFHDDHGHTFCYLCSINAHEHERTKPRDESKRRKLIPYKNPKARLSSSLDRLAQDSSSSNLISYRFIVRTGTKKNSGTRAQVFLYIYGTEKNWSSIHLQNSSTTTDGFPSGSNRTFCLKGPDIGQLHHLNVNLVGSRSNKEWFLKEIEITNLNTSTTWLCEYDCWLPKIDEQENNQIKQTVHRHADFSLSIYILQIRTGDKPLAGTDSNVQITVRGSASQTRPLALTSSRANLFEQNQLDTFAIVGWDLGDLLEIIVESDRSQFAADWDIKEMTMWKIIPNDNHKQSHVYFPFNTWLGKKVSTLKSKREIYPSTDLQLKGPICYQVSVKTGKVMNAGTDANVFIIIYGKSGRTIIHQLDNQLKNDFERNTTSEFTIMDIDVGEIDRIKIWHDNSGPGSAWFLDSVVIQKKYSTCYTISNIYIQRLDEISNALHRQVHEQMKKNFTVHTHSANQDKRHSASQRRLKPNNGSTDSLGSSRGILRSPTMYDKASLQKKVSWNEQSIGSQDDLLSMVSQRSKSMHSLSEKKRKKEDSSHHESGHFDHQVYWISSHSYTDHQWKIKSIEEINSFDFDQTTRSLLLSDRLTLNKKIKTTARDGEDEIYEFQANRWLAKDKEDGKLEVYLTSKLIHKSTIASNKSIDSKKKHLSSQNIHSHAPHHKYEHEENLNEAKRSSPKDLGPIERSPNDVRLSSSRLSNTSKSQLNDLHTHQRNIDPSSRQNITLKQQEKLSKSNPSIDQFSSSSPITQRLKSPRNINDLSSPLSSERELLARITGEPLHHSRLTGTSSLSTNQRLQSPQSINEREPLTRISREPPFHPRSTAVPTSSSSSPHLKSPRNINDLTNPVIDERKPMTKISDQSPYHSRSTPAVLSSTDRHSKLPSNSNDLMNSSSVNPRDSLARILREPIDQSRSPVPSMPSSNQRLKSPSNSNDRMNLSVNPRESLARILREPIDQSRSPVPSISSPNQRLKSPRSPNQLTNSITSEQELLARITNEPSYGSRSSAISMNQRPKLIRQANDSINSSMDERETLTKPPSYPRSAATSMLSSSQLSKPIRLSNEPASSLTKASIEPSLKSKPAGQSNSKFSSQKSLYDQVYSSAYGTAPSDDF